MKKERVPLIGLYISAALGVVVWISFAFAWIDGRLRPWEPVSLPSSAVASHFVVFDVPLVIVESQDGRVFVQHLDPDESVWEDVPSDSLGEVAHASVGTCTYTNGEWAGFRELPGTTLANLVCSVRRSGFGSDEFRYSILTDGRIWRLHNPSLGLGVLVVFLLALPAGALLGAGVGLPVIGLAYTIAKRWEASELEEPYPWPPTLPIQKAIPYRSPRFCPKCGKKMVLTGGEGATTCSQCDFVYPSEGEFPKFEYPLSAEFQYCEQCGQEVGGALLDCPERIQGGCPFTLESSASFKSITDQMFSLSLILVAGIFLVSLILIWDDFQIWITLLCVVGPLLFGLWGIFSRWQSVQNPATGVYWERSSLFGLETCRKLVSGLEILELGFDPSERFKDPFSTLAIAEVGELPVLRSRTVGLAARVFEYSLVGLWAQGWIEIRQAGINQTHFRLMPSRTMEYRLMPGKRREYAELEGYLERRILYMVIQAYNDNPLKAITSLTLLRGLPPKSERSPPNWLIRQVRMDAVRRGLFIMSGRSPFQRYQLDHTHRDRTQQQVKLLVNLHQQAAGSHPVFLEALRKSIQSVVSRKVG